MTPLTTPVHPPKPTWLNHIPPRLHDLIPDAMTQGFEVPRKETSHGTGHDRVVVQEHFVDFSDEVLATAARLAIVLSTEQPGCHYLNPMFTVSAQEASFAFSFHAEACCNTWCGRLDRTVRIRGRKSILKVDSKLERMLRHTGVLVTGGVVKDARPLLRFIARVRKGKRTGNVVRHDNGGNQPQGS